MIKKDKTNNSPANSLSNKIPNYSQNNHLVKDLHTSLIEDKNDKTKCFIRYICSNINVMRNSIFTLSILTIALLVNSCSNSLPEKKDYSKEVDEGSFSGNTYSNKVLGWEITFPETWIVTEKKSLENADERSKAMVGDTTTSTKTINRLLAFQKNYDNNFQSTREDFKGRDAASYHAIKNAVRKQVYFAYLDQRFNVDTTSSSEKVDGVAFDCFEIKLFDQTGKKFATQLLYSTIRNESYFNVIINYSNEKDKATLLNTFRKSRFNK